MGRQSYSRQQGRCRTYCHPTLTNPAAILARLRRRLQSSAFATSSSAGFLFRGGDRAGAGFHTVSILVLVLVCTLVLGLVLVCTLPALTLGASTLGAGGLGLLWAAFVASTLGAGGLGLFLVAGGHGSVLAARHLATQ